MAKKSHEAQKARLIDALSAEESPLRDAGVEMITEFLLDRRAAELVDVQAIVEVTLAALAEDNVGRVVAEHLSPAWDRHRRRAEAAKDTVGDAVPSVAQKKLLDIAEKTRLPPGAWAKGAVDPALLRELFAPVLQSTLLAFAKKLPVMGSAESGASGASGGSGEGTEGDESGRLGGIAGRLRKEAQKGAEKLASVGKSALGSLGAELDKRMSETAKEFSKEAGKELAAAVRDRLASPRGAELAGQIRRQLLARLLTTEVAVLMLEVEMLPRTELEALFSPVIAHNAGRAFLAAALEEELRAALDVEGDKSLRALADDLGVIEEARAAITRTVDPLARELFGSRAFAAWLLDVLAI
jgi:hypothetical protein